MMLSFETAFEAVMDLMAWAAAVTFGVVFITTMVLHFTTGGDDDN